MQINILYGLEGAKQATGTVVIVDIFRAASVEAYLLSKGVMHILPVSTKEEAFKLKNNNPDYILVGETNGIKIEGFDFGNSPCEIRKAGIKGKVAVHRTSQGTQGLVNANRADEIIFGSFVTHAAIKKYILTKNPAVVSIVAMDGPEGEDYEFAKYLKRELEGQANNMREIIDKLTTTRSWYLDPSIHEFPKEDFEMCLTLDTFDFICLVEKKNKILMTVKLGLK